MIALGAGVIVTLTGEVMGRDEISGNVLIAFETGEGTRKEWIDATAVTVVEPVEEADEC